jgi:hypothetical protein
MLTLLLYLSFGIYFSKFLFDVAIDFKFGWQTFLALFIIFAYICYILSLIIIQFKDGLFLEYHQMITKLTPRDAFDKWWKTEEAFFNEDYDSNVMH